MAVRKKTMTKKAKTAKPQIDVDAEVMQLEEGRLNVFILGVTPLIYNRLHGKRPQPGVLNSPSEILYPLPKNQRDLTALKHDPVKEFRMSVHKAATGNGSTRLAMPAAAFKGALCGVSVDLAGVTKAGMGRHSWVEGMWIEIFGVPQILMSDVRLQDIPKTPDVRTRAIMPEWACRLSIRYASPMLNEKRVINTLAAAGVLQGVGDWRVEKGKGSYGQFELVSEDNIAFRRIVKNGGRVAQDAAMKDPVAFDARTEDELNCFFAEVVRRGQHVNQATWWPSATTKKPRKSVKKAA